MLLLLQLLRRGGRGSRGRRVSQEGALRRWEERRGGQAQLVEAQTRLEKENT